MTNVLYSGFSNEHADVLVHLEQRLRSDNVHVIANTANDVKINTKTFFRTRDCQLGYFQEGLGYDDVPLSQELLDKLSQCESTTLKMIERYQHTDGLLTYDARIDLYHRQVRHWYNFLTEEKIGLCVFVNLPHVVFDYVIYSLCKLLNIKFIAMYRLPIMPHRGVSLYTLSDIETHIEGLRETYDYYLRHPDEAQLSDRIKCYLELKRGNAGKTFTGVTKSSTGFLSRLSSLIVPPLRVLSSNRAEDICYIVGNRIRRMQIKKPTYETEPDLGAEYIYVALHFQPECTTCPMGGAFVHQDLMIDILKRSRRRGTKLYIKEHPRAPVSSRVYEKVNGGDDVVFIDPHYSSYELIKNSTAVATVTGTAGWEGFLNNKPVLMFGDYFYQAAPGVFKVKSRDDCAEALSKIYSGMAQISDAQIVAFLKAVDQHSFPGWVDHRYQSVTATSAEENSKNLAEQLAQALQNGVTEARARA